MLSSFELVKGQLYFMVQYEDAGLTKPMVASYEYLGRPEKESEEKLHIFRILGSEEVFFLSETNLDIVDLKGLINELQRFQVAGNGGLENDS